MIKRPSTLIHSHTVLIQLHTIEFGKSRTRAGRKVSLTKESIFSYSLKTCSLIESSTALSLEIGHAFINGKVKNTVRNDTLERGNCSPTNLNLERLQA